MNTTTKPRCETGLVIYEMGDSLNERPYGGSSCLI